MKLSTKKILNTVFQVFLFIIAFIFLFPAFLTILNSFKPDAVISSNPLSFPVEFTLDNYIEAWKETRFPRVLFNTFIITVLSTTGIILISSMAAYALARSKWKISWILFLFFTLAMVVPFQTIMVPLVILAKDLNLIKTAGVLGIVPVYMGLLCPMAIFMYHGFIKGVPIEMEEAAAIDGASRFRIFFQIVLPLLGPITATIIILDVLWIWNDFLLPLIILPKQSTIQLAQFGFFSLFKQEYGKGMASLVLSASPVVIFYLIMQKFIVKGVTAGSVKG